MPFILVVSSNIPDRLRGRLSQKMLELRAGVFLSSGNAREREETWKEICADLLPKSDVLMAWNADNSFGVDFRSVGEDRRALFEMDGAWVMRIAPYIRKDPEAANSD